MTTATFDAVLLSGHKQDAVELPFDPSERWHAKPVALWPGRRGHRVAGSLNGIAFDGAIVGRSKRHYLLVEEAVRAQAGVQLGDTVHVVVHPVDAP